MLAPFLAVALSFPSVVYTVLLGVAVVYWLFVMVGAAHVDALGDGAADGIDVGGHHGVDVADGGHGHVDVDGHVDAHDAHGAHDGALAGILASLKLRSAPATVVLSVLVLFSWLFSVLCMQRAAVWLPDGGALVRFAVFVMAPLLALPLTSLVVRPLARVFVAHPVAANQQLVGKVATVRTGTVTDRFGEATLEDGGAGLVVRVRVEAGEVLKRGEQVVILGYDDERQEFRVAPMDNLLDDEREPGDAKRDTRSARR